MAASQTAPRPGFDDPVIGSQAVFRGLLDAMARPGRPIPLAPARLLVEPSVPAPLSAEAALACLTLLDVDTCLWLDGPAAASEALRRYLAFHCGCPIVAEPAAADFALVTDPRAMPPLRAFGQGDAEYPDRSTTVILQIQILSGGAGEALETGVVLRGPGIETSRRFAVAPLPPGFWDQVRANRARFPRGVDLVFVAPGAVAALPRSTRIENTAEDGAPCT